MNRKGNALAVIVWMAAVIIVIFFLAGYVYFFNSMTEALEDAGDNVNTPIVNITDAVEKVIVPVNNAMQSLEWISFILLVTLSLAILIEAYYIREHPVLFAVHALIIILGVVASLYVSNAYEDLLQSGPLASTLQGFTASNYIALYLPLWVVVVGFFGLLLLMINANRDPQIKVGGGL